MAQPERVGRSGPLGCERKKESYLLLMLSTPTHTPLKLLLLQAMKRASPSCDDLLVSRKRSCYVTEEENAGVNECCSSASPVQLTVNTPIKLPPGAVLLQELPAAAMVRADQQANSCPLPLPLHNTYCVPPKAKAAQINTNSQSRVGLVL